MPCEADATSDAGATLDTMPALAFQSTYRIAHQDLLCALATTY